MAEFNLVDSFISTVRNIGYLRSNRFAVMMKMNNTVRQLVGNPSFTDMNTRLSQFCKTATLPERSISTLDRTIVGTKRKIGYRSNYGDSMSMTFHFAADAKEMVMFSKWQEMIVDPVTRRLGYYADYAMGCKLLVLMLPNYIKNYDQVIEAAERKQLPGMLFDEVYPLSTQINEGTMSSETPNGIATFKVTMNYRDVYHASFDEMVKHGYVALDEREFTPAGKLLDPNASVPPVETIESTQARMDAVAQNGFVIVPGVNDAALNRNREYLNLTPKPADRSLSFNQILNLAALL